MMGHYRGSFPKQLEEKLVELRNLSLRGKWLLSGVCVLRTCMSSCDRPKLSISCLTSTYQVFLLLPFTVFDETSFVFTSKL